VSYALRTYEFPSTLITWLVTTCLWTCVGVFPSLHAQDAERNARLTIHMSSVAEICPNTPFTLRPDSITGGLQPYRYSWFLSSDIFSTDDSATVNISDTTTITLQVMGADGKIEREAIQLIPYTAMDAGFDVDIWEGCSPVEVRFTSNYVAFQNISGMRWHYGTGEVDNQLASAVYEYRLPGLYYPALSITDLHGCIWTDTLNTGVRVFPTPIADFRIREDKLYLPDTHLAVENTSEGATHYLWHFPGGEPMEGFEPDMQFPTDREGQYELTLYAENAYGCDQQASKTIEVVQGIELYLPNAFTPDGDGINDVWQPRGLGVDAFHVALEIYDVWGTIVYSSTDLQAPWSGRSEPLGLYVPPGQYNYRIIARDTERGIGHLFEGYVMVIW
jgi:gliding motility-associated-like protein